MPESREAVTSRLEAAEKVVAIARELSLPKNWVYHDCKGPSCRICVKLPDAVADYDSEYGDA